MRISVLGPVVRTTLVISLSCFSFVDAAAQSPSPVAPTQIPVAGRLLAVDGQPRTGAVDLVISLYDTQSDANPRWIEQQLGVPLDAGGGYSIQFGATMPDGLPGDLFATDGGARWLGVAVQGEAEQPRVMLLSVPYAARAASAETLGGKSASDFVLAASFRDDVRSALEESGVDDDVTTLGTNGFVAKFDAMGDPTADSVMFDDGTGIGIGTTTPASLFHMRGNLNTPAFRLENTEPGGATWQVTSANDGQLRFTEVGAAVRMVINRTTGTVGIGTQAPQALMHLRAGLNLPAFRLENTEAAGAAWQVTSANDGQFRLTEVGAAARLVVNKATGNVGIGVGAPAAKLHVGGNVTVDGALAGPTITSLQNELAALTARLAKLEGTETLVEDDFVGTYSLNGQMTMVGLENDLANIGAAVLTGTVVLNSGGTGSVTSRIQGNFLTQGTPTWSLASIDEDGTEPLTWTYDSAARTLIVTNEDGQVTTTTVSAGGRVLVSVSQEEGEGPVVIILTRR